jgi:hypothetical protein
MRDETDLQNKTDYIEANPLLWDDDEMTKTRPIHNRREQHAKLHLRQLRRSIWGNQINPPFAAGTFLFDD